jgi:hypothetical protein
MLRRLTLSQGVPQSELLPILMSLNASFSLYIKGFKKQRGGDLFDSLASFNKLTKPTNVGDDAEVPPIEAAFPRKNIRNRSAYTDTSGIA